MRRGRPYQVEPLRRLLLEAVERGELSFGADNAKCTDRIHPSGVPYRTLRRIMFEEVGFVGECLLDRIVCGVLGDPSLWHTERFEPVPAGRVYERRQPRESHRLRGSKNSPAHIVAKMASQARQPRDQFGRFVAA